MPIAKPRDSKDRLWFSFHSPDLKSKKNFFGFYLSDSRWELWQRTLLASGFWTFKALWPGGQMSVGQGTVPAWRLHLCYLFLVNDRSQKKLSLGELIVGGIWAWHRVSSLGGLLLTVDNEVTDFREGWSLVGFPVMCNSEPFSDKNFVMFSLSFRKVLLMPNYIKLELCKLEQYKFLAWHRPGTCILIALTFPSLEFEFAHLFSLLSLIVWFSQAGQACSCLSVFGFPKYSLGYFMS